MTTAYILGEGGGIIAMSLPLSEPIADRLEKGYLRRVNADGTPFVEAEKIRPAINESKKAWVGWAVHNGMKPDDAEALTKTDLIEKFGVDPK